MLRHRDLKWTAVKLSFESNNKILWSLSEMDIQILSEEQYRKLQKFGEFDLKTSS